MKGILIGHDTVIREWLRDKLQITIEPNQGQVIGYSQDEKIIAAVLVEQYNGVNCLMHVAADSTKRWCTREFLGFCFGYVFNQLGCRRVTGLVGETNVAARRLDEHLGFELETRLEKATLEGDLLVYVMWKEKCRWIRSNQDEFRQG